jgi:hypothetical protein
MTYWQEHHLDDLVVEILGRVPTSHPNHHLGRPYLTVYQIAIAFDLSHHNHVVALGLEVGGAGTGLRYSLAQRIARYLSHDIRVNRERSRFEGSFLSTQHIGQMFFGDVNNPVRSSVSDISMFRLR